MPALIAKDVLERAQTFLQDPDAVRWPILELATALNDALLEICLVKPSACAETVILNLQPGTLQKLEADQAQFLRAVCNITSAAEAPRAAGPAITPIERDALDNQIPGWHAAATYPRTSLVQHVITDPMNPTDFYVFPGNDGTGRMEAMVAVTPTLITIPGDPTDLAGYTDEIDLNPVYKSVLVDFILYQAFAKDMQLAGSSQRAMAYYQSFMTKLGARRQIEAVATPDTT